MEITSFISDFEQLPIEIQKQLMDYLEFLMKKHSNKSKKQKKTLKFDWEDGLKDLKKKYSSVELQHLTNNLR